MRAPVLSPLTGQKGTLALGAMYHQTGELRAAMFPTCVFYFKRETSYQFGTNLYKGRGGWRAERIL